MCLAFMMLGQFENFPTVLLFNRDETYTRPTEPLKVHVLGKDIFWVGGRDLEKGGTWAGVNHQGRFGMITFYREPRCKKSPARARGELVPGFLLGNEEPSEFLSKLEASASDYLGFNLILGDSKKCFHYCNLGGGITKLEKGIFGVSNANLESPWFKVTQGKKAISELASKEAFDAQSYFTILADTQEAPREQVQKTGLAYDYERLRSPLFVQAKTYGTRSSSIIYFDSNSKVTFEERTYGDSSKVFEERRFSFTV